MRKVMGTWQRQFTCPTCRRVGAGSPTYRPLCLHCVGGVTMLPSHNGLILEDWRRVHEHEKAVIAAEGFAAGLYGYTDPDLAADYVFDAFDRLFKTGEFEAVDHMIGSVDPRRISMDVLLAILTASLPARSKLPSRRPLFEFVREALVHHDGPHDREQILAGLE